MNWEIFFLPAFSFLNSQWLFLRGMAFIYFVAFWSLDRQVMGLYGAQGILPIHDMLTAVKKSIPKSYWKKYISIFWLSSSDRTIRAASIGGMIFSLLAFLGIYPAPFFLILYLLYLSFHSVGGEFLSYQWDCLLLEVGFITVFFAIQTPPPWPLLILLWFFLFRFMFASGIVKILSHCPYWKSFTAMDFHYETQPLPNRIAYYMHQMHPHFGKFSQGFVYFTEMIIPFFIFTPMPLRFVTFLFLVFLQILIFLSGNYAFFNLLTIVMCIPLLDDIYLPFNNTGIAFDYSLLTSVPLTIIAILMLFLNGLQFASLFLNIREFTRIYLKIIPFRILNQYGLFAMMTVERNEIIIEGSYDGKEWLPYEFFWKPGNVKRPPLQIAPHQPRLDWQMWFASLRSYKYEFWLTSFMYRLLEGSPEVLKLIKHNPFTDVPPRYIRAQFYKYHFSNAKTKRETDAWWTRRYLGQYSPILHLKNDYQFSKDEE